MKLILIYRLIYNRFNGIGILIHMLNHKLWMSSCVFKWADTSAITNSINNSWFPLTQMLFIGYSSTRSLGEHPESLLFQTVLLKKTAKSTKNIDYRAFQFPSRGWPCRNTYLLQRPTVIHMKIMWNTVQEKEWRTSSTELGEFSTRIHQCKCMQCISKILSSSLLVSCMASKNQCSLTIS